MERLFFFFFFFFLIGYFIKYAFNVGLHLESYELISLRFGMLDTTKPNNLISKQLTLTFTHRVNETARTVIFICHTMA